MSIPFEFPLGVVAHDAGAANHILSWLARVTRDDITCHFAGPAALFDSPRLPGRRSSDLSDVLAGKAMLLSGSGWGSRLEHDARALAKGAGTYSVAVLDHWVDYRARFTRESIEVLPDELWVVDAYALELAHQQFPDVPVRQLPNLYMERLVAEIKREESSAKPHERNHVLFVLEPIRRSWGKGEAGEFQALNYFMASFDALGLRDPIIRLRPHPSDSIGKYDKWVEAQRRPNLAIDSESSLTAHIAWADTVVGCETYAMVVALEAGKRVVTAIPPWAPPCILPHHNLVRLADLFGPA